MYVLKVILILMLFIDASYCGLFSWLFKSYENSNDKENAKNLDFPVNNDVSSAKIPFEMSVADEKFMKEISSLSSMPELDKCHHKVIMSLQSTCSDMNEEELSKIAVNLLNCQSFIEGRIVYPCTNDMSLKECTENMDLNTWNAYHIVSNRARAVCYQLRQQQFKSKTEFIINKLILTAHDQIDAMKQLELTQSNIKDATSKTFENLNFGHKILLEKQQHLSSAQHSIHSHVASNLRELAKEKRLIALGQKELTHITESIKSKLGDAQEQLKNQGEHQKESHEKILSDLETIHKNAEKVHHHLNKSTAKILQTHEDTIQFYQHLMDDLENMNQTVYHLTNLLLSMRMKVEERFSWLSSLLGDTDETIKAIYSIILHTSYFLISVVCAGFLKVPYFTRIALIILVPLNAFYDVNNSSCLEFSTVTAVLTGILISNLFMQKLSFTDNRCLIKARVGKIEKEQNKKYITNNLNHKKNDDVIFSGPQYDINTKSHDEVNNLQIDPEDQISHHVENKISAIRRRLITKLDDSAQYSERDGSPLRHENLINNSSFLNRTVTPKKNCGAICKNGSQCRNTASPSYELCYRHLNSSRDVTPAL